MTGISSALYRVVYTPYGHRLDAPARIVRHDVPEDRVAGIDIDGHGLERVDGHYGVGAAFLGRHADVPDVGDVGRQLHPYGSLTASFTAFVMLFTSAGSVPTCMP